MLGMIRPPPPATVARFRADLEKLSYSHNSIAVAVSGGPDSLALLLLAHAAFPGRIHAATVDHRLRPESAAEAVFVADIAADLHVPHTTLAAEWPKGPPASGIQEAAREARYAALLGWCADQGINVLLTAHHADDQAETLLMRLNRGAGLPGLAGVRPSQPFGSGLLLRPLLGWRSHELRSLCEAAGLTPIEDPSNADPRHERSRIRRLLRAADALDAEKVALSAAHLLEVEDAIRWLVDEVVRTRVEIGPGGASFDAAGLPREIQRRVLALLVGPEARGSAVARAVERLDSGRPATLAGLRLRPGERWTVTAAPPRRAI
jgi:tRNA(Ile)-lysidine synthase